MEKFLNNKFIMILLILPFIEPSGIEDLARFVGGIWSDIHIIFVLLKWVSFIIVGIVFLSEAKKPDKFFLMILVYQVCTLSSTIINGNLYLSNISTAANTLGAVLLFDYYLKYGKAKDFLSVVEALFSIWIIINFISIIIFSNGIYIDDRGWNENWFLGYKSRHIYYYIPFLYIQSVLSALNGKKCKKKFYVFFLIIISSVYLSTSKTGLLALLFSFVLIVFFRNKNVSCKLSIRNVYIVSAVISYLIVFLEFQKNFEFLIVDILNKDLTMHARSYIWNLAIKFFHESPIIGNGLISFSDLFSTWTVTQMHNMYMDILVVGGIMLLAVFTFMILMIDKKVKQCTILEIKNISNFIFVGYGILFITEARRDMVLLSICLATMYYLPDLIKRYGEDKTKSSIVKC